MGLRHVIYVSCFALACRCLALLACLSTVPFTGIQFQIICKPGRAACGKDHLLFLWERANFAPLQSRNYDANQYRHFEGLNTSVRCRELQNLVEIGATSLVGEIYYFLFSVVISTFFLLLVSLIRLQTTIRNGF